MMNDELKALSFAPKYFSSFRIMLFPFPFSPSLSFLCALGVLCGEKNHYILSRKIPKQDVNPWM